MGPVDLNTLLRLLCLPSGLPTMAHVNMMMVGVLAFVLLAHNELVTLWTIPTYEHAHRFVVRFDMGTGAMLYGSATVDEVMIS